MTTARQMIPALGAHVFVRFEELTVECWIKDVKNSWGKPRLLIVPVTGTGEQWVELGRVIVPATATTTATAEARHVPQMQPGYVRRVHLTRRPLRPVLRRCLNPCMGFGPCADRGFTCKGVYR